MQKLIQYLRKHYYISYTLVFLIMCIAVFGVFWYNGKNFIFTGEIGDGVNQHYTAYLYYGRYLRTIIKSILFDHTLSIPTFSMSIGYGSDIIDTLHYYVIGDPICALTVFVPSKLMPLFYNFSILLRLWLAGLSFSKLCFYINEKRTEKFSKTAVMIGAFIYVFCGYALFTCVLHPFFINPMIYFPLVLLGVEMIIDKKKPYIFILSVFLSAISNFYFFYMIVILTILYVVWRLITKYKSNAWREVFGCLGKISIYSILGTSMSAVVLIPVLIFFAGDVRSENGYIHDALYTLSDYQKTISGFISVNSSHDYIYLGYGIIALIAVFLLFLQKKKYNNIKAAFIIMGIMMLFPIVGRIMNGYSYVCNRWIFGFSLLIGYIVVITWDTLMNVTSKEKLQLFLCLSGYLILCIVMTQSRTIDFFFAMTLSFIFLFLISINRNHYTNIIKAVCVLCVFVSIASNAYFMYSPRFNDYVSKFADAKDFYNDYNKTEATALEKLTNDEGFNRYTGSITRNRTLDTGLHSTQYYWSLSNGNITTFQFENNLNYSSPQNFMGLDSRTGLCTLANVRYFIKESKDKTLQPPYEFSSIGSTFDYKNLSDFLSKELGDNDNESELTDNEKEILEDKYLTKYTVYENDCSLPFGYTYENYLNRKSYESLNPVEKQEAMLQSIVIDNVQDKIEASPKYTSDSLNYSIDTSEDVQWENHTITVTKEKGQVTLNFIGDANSENYLYIKGLSYQGISPRDNYTDIDWLLESTLNKNEIKYKEKFWEAASSVNLSISSTNEENKTVSNSITCRTAYDKYYSNQTDYLTNLYYDELPRISVTITFPTTGIYTYDDLEIICQPMDNYEDQVNALKVDTLENVDFHDNNTAFATNKVTGKINLDQEKYLLMTIPYSDGWTAYVDGEEQELLQANTMYMALKLNAGDHDIELKYQTPGLTLGFYISLVAFAIFLVVVVISEGNVKISKRHHQKKRRKRIA